MSSGAFPEPGLVLTSQYPDLSVDRQTGHLDLAILTITGCFIVFDPLGRPSLGFDNVAVVINCILSKKRNINRAQHDPGKKNLYGFTESFQERTLSVIRNCLRQKSSY